MARLLGGILHLKINGTVVVAKGDFTFGMGLPKYEAVLSSSNRVAGFKATPTVPYIEGEIFQTGDVDLKDLLSTRNALVVLEFEGGKTYALDEAHFAADGEVTTADGSVKVRFDGTSMSEV